MQPACGLRLRAFAPSTQYRKHCPLYRLIAEAFLFDEKRNQRTKTWLISFLALLAIISTVRAADLQLPVSDGPFKPDWNSLAKYQCPEWFRDAKSGIWAHWGSQCEPEDGDWYARNMYLEGSDQYKTAANVIPMLVDIVSKNGNLMLNVPLGRDGQPDADEMKIVQSIGAWLKVNGAAIYATRPWKIYGEGPSTIAQEKAPFDRTGVKDVGSKPFTAEDIRFTQSKDGKTLYAITLSVPTSPLRIKSLAGSTIAGSPSSLELPRRLFFLGRFTDSPVKPSLFRFSRQTTVLCERAPRRELRRVRVIFRIMLNSREVVCFSIPVTTKARRGTSVIGAKAGLGSRWLLQTSPFAGNRPDHRRGLPGPH